MCVLRALPCREGLGTGASALLSLEGFSWLVCFSASYRYSLYLKLDRNYISSHTETESIKMSISQEKTNVKIVSAGLRLWALARVMNIADWWWISCSAMSGVRHDDLWS